MGPSEPVTRVRHPAITQRRRYPLWRKAPARLLHRPGLFVALSIAALLVVVPVSSFPLFVSASQSELLTSAIDAASVSRYAAGLTYRSTDIPFAATGPGGGRLYEERGVAFAEAARSPELDPVIAEVFGATVDVRLPGGSEPDSGPVDGRLFAGDDVVGQLQILAGEDGDGVWLPDIIAEPTGAAPGDRLELRSGDQVVTVLVNGIYRGLYALPHMGYFQPFNDAFYKTRCVDCPIPPQPIILAADELVAISTALGEPSATFAWQAPAREDPPLTLEQARAIGPFAEDMRERMGRPHTPLGQRAPCCGRVVIPRSTGFTRFPENELRTAMPGIVGTVEERSAAARAPVFVLTLAALAVALSVVAAASAFASAARRTEVGVLSALGWSPGAVALKHTLESLVPILVGAVVGVLASATLIDVVVPGGRVDLAARNRALALSAWAALAALAVIAVVSAVSYVAGHEHPGRLARALRWAPWELLALGAAWAFYRSLHAPGDLARPAGEPAGAAVFLLPLALSMGVGIIVARGLVAALGRRRPRGRGISAWFMAERRLAASRHIAALFLVASAMSLAVFASSQAIAASLRSTVDAKAGVFVGGDVQVHVGLDAEPDTDGYPYPVTSASRLPNAGTLHGTERRFDLVAIDPETLPAAAFWDDAFSDASLGRLLDGLSEAPGDPLPIIVSNGAGSSFHSVELADRTMDVRVVGTTSSFPGTSSSDRPLIVVSQPVLEENFAAMGRPNPLNAARATHELWIDGEPDAVLGSLDALNVFPLSTLTADDVKDIPYIDAAIDTFTVLNVLGLAALLLVVVVAIVYLQARQRDRALGAVLSARMGMTMTMLRRSLVLELAAVMGVALIIGGAVGAVSVDVVVPSVDPLPTVPPSPLILRPGWSLVGAGLVLLIAAWIGGLLAARTARELSVGEVMRAAE